MRACQRWTIPGAPPRRNVTHHNAVEREEAAEPPPLVGAGTAPSASLSETMRQWRLLRGSGSRAFP
jgi:hypothetical protein